MDQNVRPDFYDSQFLAAEDLDAVVDYHRFQHARHLLGAHTWGIGAGLDLRERKLPTGDVEVTLLPGIAWDGYGRTIVVLAPARIGPEKFVNFEAVTPADGQLIKVWLRYTETPSKPPAHGFEVCRPDGQFAQIVETFAIEVGEPDEPPHGSVTVAGRTVQALKARTLFIPNATDVFDESIPYQAFPGPGNRPVWLVPIGYVRWLKQLGQPGRLIARKDGPNATPDSDVIRAFRHYIGDITETILAADGLVRVRDRRKDPAVSPVRLPRIALDPAKPPENDLVWIEGALHVLADARVSGGIVELRNPAAVHDGVPLALRRIEANALAGKDLQVIVGADAAPAGKHALVVGVGKLDTASGALKADFTRRVVIRDDGKVGIGIDQPTELLTLGGDGNTRLEIGRISGSLPWGTTTPTNPGAFVINQQSQGSSHVGADFGLMRDRKLRLALGDKNTFVSGQAGDVVLSVNFNEPGETEVMRATQAANIGIGTSNPVAKLQIAGDVAINQMSSGGPRPLPTGATLIWNDGTWLRLNQNLDFTRPITGVRIEGQVVLNGATTVNGGLVANGGAVANGGLVTNGGATINGGATVNGGTTLNGGATINGGTVVNGGSVINGNEVINGSLFCSGIKFFSIPHPFDPQGKRLMHASLEGPEAAVFYRGEAVLSRGRATITLPDYFERLTAPDGRTVLVTPIYENDQAVTGLAATRVRNGQFEVRAITQDNPTQRFCWEVKARRADVELLVEVAAG